MSSQRKAKSRQNEVRFGAWHHRFLRESTNENGPFAGVVRRLYTWDRHKSPSGGATKRRTELLQNTEWLTCMRGATRFYGAPPGATISARLLRVYLRLSARPRILAGRRIAQARFEPEPCRRASGFAWPAVKSPLQPYGLSPPAKPRMPPEAARECAPAGLHE